MDYKLMISIFALIISAISLILSIRTNSFNKNVKGIELRANVLLKFSEAISTISAARNYLTEVKIEAEEKNDLKLYKLVSKVDIFESLSEQINRMHEEAKKIDVSKGVNMYQNIFHELHSMKMNAETELENTKNSVKKHTSNQT